MGCGHVITHRERISARAMAHPTTRQWPSGQNSCLAHENNAIGAGKSWNYTPKSTSGLLEPHLVCGLRRMRKLFFGALLDTAIEG
jgi:hypothetical protein